jgi:chromosome segregation ATPase
MSLSRQELEQINDQLQVQLKEAQDQLKNAPPPSLAEENARLLEEMEELQQSLEESERRTRELRETLTAKELGRQNELLQLEQDRERVKELREMDVQRIEQRAREMASERDRWQTEMDAKEEELRSAKIARFEAENRERGWKEQSTEASKRMREAETRMNKALEQVGPLEAKVQRLEREHNQALTQVQCLQDRPLRRSLIIEMFDSLSERWGCWLMLLVVTIFLGMAIYVVSSIVSWWTQPAPSPLGF